MNLSEAFLKHVKTMKYFSPGDRILIGMSGGPDSTALAYLLADLQKEFGLYLHAAHLNHGLRAAAPKDAEFVKATAQRLGIPCTCGFIPVRTLKNKASIEEVAREHRLKFLIKIAENNRCPKIVLAHTQDDQAETVLMNLLRGTGLMGLRGILPVNKMGGRTLVRPLLDFRKKDILAYLKRNRLSYRVDSSNRSPDFLRNRIRHAAIPLLNQISQKNIVPSLSRLTQSITADYDFLETVGRKELKHCQMATSNQSITLKINTLQSLHPSLRRMVIRLALIQLQGSARRLSFEHILDIDHLLLSPAKTGTRVLPKAIRILKSAKVMKFQLPEFNLEVQHLRS